MDHNLISKERGQLNSLIIFNKSRCKVTGSLVGNSDERREDYKNIEDVKILTLFSSMIASFKTNVAKITISKSYKCCSNNDICSHSKYVQRFLFVVRIFFL